MHKVLGVHHLHMHQLAGRAHTVSRTVFAKPERIPNMLGTPLVGPQTPDQACVGRDMVR